MPVIIRTTEMAYKDQNGNYIGLDSFSERKTEEEIADIERAGAAAREVIAEFNQTAEKWAVGQKDGVDVPTTDPTYENNSKYHAGRANSFATTASTKATEAANSATAAAGSATTATTKATAAAGSATTASTKATEAANSATAAAGSATTATTKATEAAGSATAAANSASTASTKASEASTSASTASTKATAAANSASSAETAASHYPYVDSGTGNWMVWNVSAQRFDNTGVHAQGEPGTPGDATITYNSTTKKLQIAF